MFVCVIAVVNSSPVSGGRGLVVVAAYHGHALKATKGGNSGRHSEKKGIPRVFCCFLFFLWTHLEQEVYADANPCVFRTSQPPRATGLAESSGGEVGLDPSVGVSTSPQ